MARPKKLSAPSEPWLGSLGAKETDNHSNRVLASSDQIAPVSRETNACCFLYLCSEQCGLLIKAIHLLETGHEWCHLWRRKLTTEYYIAHFLEQGNAWIFEIKSCSCNEYYNACNWSWVIRVDAVLAFWFPGEALDYSTLHAFTWLEIIGMQFSHRLFQSSGETS